ncbi:MAG: SP_1767 family glycosyltransferase [Saprospiraceae bacterium]|nr:SP_1767 family glycosyltransferase [Saprospiraceae bacterium]
MNLQYSKYFKYPRKVIKYTLNLLYPFVIEIFPLPKVMSISETLDQIVHNNMSICRLGDGEFQLIIDKLSLPFQEYDETMVRRLCEILASKRTDVLIGLPIGYYGIAELKFTSKVYWRSNIVFTYPRLRKYLDLNKTYANASISRFYIEYQDRNVSTKYLNQLRSIWEKKHITIIEGEKSRLGAGNDLFNTCLSIRRILGPAHNAFSKYDEIFESAEKEDKSRLILLALGSTATILAYDLSVLGYQAVDIGNVDIEYEWYKIHAKDKVKVEGKYTSEAKGGREVSESIDQKYLSEIISKHL